MRPDFTHPRAITMWDFSWLERRWPGAGYEDWGVALDELAERGYDAVRIDAYPHLVAKGATKAWNLLPGWTQTSWGAQSPITVTVLPALLEFISEAKQRGIGVALSTWYREDADNSRMEITTPEKQAQIWIDTLAHIEAAGLLDAILYVDLCNEFPAAAWAPYLYEDPSQPTVSKTEPRIGHWMNESIRLVRASYPDLDYTYSFSNEYGNLLQQDVSEFDVLEPHVWMGHPETSDFQERVGYHFERFEPIGFDNLAKNARREYFSRQEHYDTALFASIDQVVEWSRATGKGMYTTECWALVDWKDWPGLEWDWIKDLTELGLTRAAQSGRWVGLATSNFCGPQFVGMWRDVEWHQRLTSVIKSSLIDSDIRRRLTR